MDLKLFKILTETDQQIDFDVTPILIGNQANIWISNHQIQQILSTQVASNTHMLTATVGEYTLLL